MTKARDVEHPSSGADAGAEVNGVTHPCRGWIRIVSHYVNHHLASGEDIAVGYTAKLYQLGGGSETLVETVEVFYSTLKLPTASATGDAPAVAAANGNPYVNLGGATGYAPGKYRLTLHPKVAHGKLRLRSEPEKDGTYAILTTTGEDSKRRTDVYVQVPSTTPVERAWSETIDLRCGAINKPQVVTFAWADFKTWDGFTNARITGAGNMNSPTLEASAACITKISPAMTKRLGTDWQQVAARNAFFPLHPVIRYWTFTFINKIEELSERRVRVTNPGRSAEYQAFLRERKLQCNGAKAAPPWESNHQYGLAFDAAYGQSMDQAPTAGDHGDVQVRVSDAVGFEWGGDWRSPDRPHFEYPGATGRLSGYFQQLRGPSPTILQYGGFDYVVTP